MIDKASAYITAIASYLPERVLTNSDLEKIVDTNNEWIISRTGIEERRIAANDEYPSNMGAKASEKALAKADIAAQDIDIIITASMTPDYITPSTAALIQAQLKAVNAAAVDIQAACSGFLYGLSIARAYVLSGIYRNVLFVATEKMSSFLDYEDRSTCVIFGDGACAAVIQREPHQKAENISLRIDDVSLGSDGQLADLVIIPGGGARHPASAQTITDKKHYFHMNGRETFKYAVRRMSQAAQVSLKNTGVELKDIQWIIPHQANVRIIDALTRSFQMPEDKAYKTIHKYGNTSGASVGIALSDLMDAAPLENDAKLLLLAFGGGLTWGASILTVVTHEGSVKEQ